MPTDEEFDSISKLENILGQAVAQAGVGELDGNEIGGGEFTIWLYGSDAAKLADVVKSTLEGKKLPKGCHLFLRHGGVKDEHAKEETIAIES